MPRRLFLLILVLAARAAHADDRLILKGLYEQGGIIIGNVEPGARLTLDGWPVRVSPEGHFVFGFDRDHGPEAALRVTYSDGTSEARTFVIAPRQYDIQRIDGLPPEKVTPRTPEEIAKIERDIEVKNAARRNVKDGAWFVGEWLWPHVGIVTGWFGAQRILNGEPRQPHYGVDIAGPVGADVRAPQGGIVTLAEADMYFEGGLIFIDHGMGLVSALMHLSRIDVASGDVVEQGQVIGGLGATGRVTGPHLDWRMWWANAHVDPAVLVGKMPDLPL